MVVAIRSTCVRSLFQARATDEEKAEAMSDIDDDYAGRQQQMESAIIQVVSLLHALH